MTDLSESSTAPAKWGAVGEKTISWYGIEPTLQALGSLSGLEFIQAMAEGKLPWPPIASHFDMRFLAIREGEIELASIPDESLLNGIGLVHGGVLCTLMDTAMGIAAQTLGAPGVAWASIELKVSFLKPIPYDGRELKVVGRVLKPGRNVSFTEGSAYDADGKLIGHGTSSLAAVGG
ncbi:MAG: PaaI family thioesterase [Solirubrobacterales bacterium]|nr:PaaI family thioesterase [Solirubrobacterales bacterium]